MLSLTTVKANLGDACSSYADIRKTDFCTRTINRDKEEYYEMIQDSIHQNAVTILNNRALECMKQNCQN